MSGAFQVGAKHFLSVWLVCLSRVTGVGSDFLPRLCSITTPEVYHLLRNSLLFEEEAISVTEDLKAQLDATHADDTTENWLTLFAGGTV